MKFGFSKFGILGAAVSLAVSPLMAQAENTEFALYCPGENKQFIGADGKFIRIDKDTYLSWTKTKQDAYQHALSRQILRSDASARAYSYVTTYVSTHQLELHRMMEDGLNNDEKLFPYRGGEIDLLRKAENEMTSAELQAYRAAREDIQSNIITSLAQKNFNTEFCVKR
jgi:hypothetical protein